MEFDHFRKCNTCILYLYVFFKITVIYLKKYREQKPYKQDPESISYQHLAICIHENPSEESGTGKERLYGNCYWLVSTDVILRKYVKITNLLIIKRSTVAD